MQLSSNQSGQVLRSRTTPARRLFIDAVSHRQSSFAARSSLTSLEIHSSNSPQHDMPATPAPRLLPSATLKLKKSLKLRLFSLSILFIVTTILIGKLIFFTNNYSTLQFYGVIVTATVCITFIISLRKYKDLSENIDEQPEDEPYLVSCLVAVYNEEAIIDQCVRSLLKSSYSNREIIIVNDASTDATAQVLQKYAELGVIKLINLPSNVGKKKALAHGMLEARGNIFVFSDSDSVIAPNAIERMIRVFKQHANVGAIGGHCRALNADTSLLTKIQDSWYEGQFSIRKAFESTYDAVSCVSGPLAAFRREAIFNYIPAWAADSFLGQEFRFATDRTLTGFVLGSEVIGPALKHRHADSPFVQRAQYSDRYWRVVYCKNARAWTKVPDTFTGLLKQQVRWKKSFIRNLFFTSTFYWRRPLPAAIYFYLHALFVLIGPFIAFRHIVYLPLQGNLLSLVLYMSGVILIGCLFGLAYKLENKHSDKWRYRPLMSLLSTFVLSWLIFYSAATIKRSVWARG